MIGSFASGNTTSLVAKNETKKSSQLFKDRFWCSSCLNDCIEVANIIGSFTSSATASLVAKNETKNYSTTVDKMITSDQILVFEVSKWPYLSAQHYRIICKCGHCLPGGKIRTKETYQTSRFFIMILHYLEADIDYRPFPFFYRVVCQNYTQQISSQFDQKWRHIVIYTINAFFV